MKNIHILPTPKPSRLYINLLDYLAFDSLQLRGSNQNIYITSNEDIKEGVEQWYLDKVLNEPYNSGNAQYSSKQDVIILTTDQDLIKDGVQAIDDEFLEWFVKNPSCEEVEIELHIGSLRWSHSKNSYKIIIPKEEPKQEYCEKCDCLVCECWEEPKQETLEEVRDLAYYKANAEEDYLAVPISVLRYISQLEQQERMYSEEEVYSIVEQAIKDNSRKQLHFFDGGYSNPIYTNLKKWFEQFKKK